MNLNYRNSSQLSSQFLCIYLIRLLFKELDVIIEAMIKRKEQQINDILKIHCLASQTTRISNDLNSTLLTNDNNKQNKIPLHSHQAINDDSIFTNYSFRLLHPTQQPKKPYKENYNIQKNYALAFGSSQKRNVKEFSGNEDLSKIKRNNNCIIGKITGKAYELEQNYQNLLQELEESRGNINQQQQKYEQVKLKKAGFGVGENLKRIQNGPKIRSNPGPGTYNISANCYFSKGVKINPENNKIMGQGIGITQNKNNLISSYQIKSPFDELARKIIAKQKIKKKVFEKKQKNSHLLSILHGQRKKPSEFQDETKINTQDPRQHAQKNVVNLLGPSQNHNIKRKHERLYRQQLRDKTANLLLRKQTKQQRVSLQEKKPLYKMMLSNSFRVKNDHAYQAHFYKPEEKESQYIFIKGGANETISRQNSSFKSNVKRNLF